LGIFLVKTDKLIRDRRTPPWFGQTVSVNGFAGPFVAAGPDMTKKGRNPPALYWRPATYTLQRTQSLLTRLGDAPAEDR